MESLSPTNQPTRPPVWQLVVRKPFNASGMTEFASWLKEKTIGYLIGEHPADEEVQSTHCHILIEGLKVTTEGLRQSLIRYDISGSSYSLMKKRKANKMGIREPYSRDGLAVYIIKGNVNYEKSSSYNDVQIALWSSTWINHTPAERSEAEQGVESNENSTTAKKKKVNTIYEDCDEIIDTIPGWSTRNPNLVERTQVVAAIIAWANNKRKALHSVQVMNYYDVVMQQAVPERYTTLCVDLINRRHR